MRLGTRSLTLASTSILWLSMLVSPASGQSTEELLAAARSGDRATLERLVGQGVPVDSTDEYGSTALIVAAMAGQADSVAWLLEQGADPDHTESFYGMTPISSALFFGEDPESVKLLLAGGADDRETAFMFAIRSADEELARAAVESGPFYESALETLRGMPMLGASFKTMLEAVESRPDPPAPVYDAEQLARYTGRYEGWDSAWATEVTLQNGDLQAVVGDGEAVELVVSGEDTFLAADETLEVQFSGRAGTIEAISIGAPGAQPQYMRRSVAEVVEGAAERVAAWKASEDASIVHWPSFRGQNASGIGDGEETLVEWDVEAGTGVLWSSELPGLGNSSPIIWGDRVFVTTAVGEGIEQGLRTGLTGEAGRVEEEVSHSWRVIAFDKSTGEELWSREVGAGLPLTQRHFKATQANSTPTTDGRYLVTVFPTAGLACLDAETGAVLWRHDLGGLNAGAFSDPAIEWGFASSPILYGDRVILQVDVHEGPFLAAWDLESGREIWRVERDVAPSWATPSILAGPEGDELVVNGSTIHGYDPKTGEELWSLGPNSELVIATPVVGERVVYVSAGYPPIKPIYALRAGTRGALEVQPGRDHERLVWSQSPGGAYMPTPLLYGGLFYLLHHNGRLVAYDASTGDAVYKTRFSKGGVFTGSPIAANGKLYLPTEEGMMYVLEAGPEYRELAINDFGEPLMATPAVSEGVLFVRTPSKLIALGAGDDAS